MEQEYDVIVSELQTIQAQQVEIVDGLQNVSGGLTALLSAVELLTAFVFVIMVYKVRDVFLSFVKKGGVKRDV